MENQTSGALDQAVLEALAAAAPAATDYYVEGMMNCSKDLQDSFVELAAMLVKGNEMYYM